MRTSFLVIIFAGSILKFGCCSSKTAEQFQSSKIGTSVDSSVSSKVPPPNAIQQNFSIVEAVVDSIVVSDQWNYRLSMFIRSAGKQENGFAAQGEHVTVSPQYVLNDAGAVDESNDRNKGLMSIRSVKKGEVVQGKISLRSNGDWILLEVSDH